jgi:serine/threonine protein kinase
LKRPISTSIDIWSLGCLVYEFLTGEALFVAIKKDGDGRRALNYNTSLAIVRQITETLDRAYSHSLLGAGLRHSWGYVAETNCNHLPPTHKGYYREKDSRYVNERLETRFARAKHPDIDDEEAAAICQLIRKLLTYDPAERPTSEELLKHP